MRNTWEKAAKNIQLSIGRTKTFPTQKKQISEPIYLAIHSNHEENTKGTHEYRVVLLQTEYKVLRSLTWEETEKKD